ncbi:lactoylglutathione lyase [Altererythrobacter marinus]|uniref:Lactoylglutathione lyase n=1 Tax=Pelagerythrobacter marinus TaxID=538382 RepID=A0ABW9UX15_9SPHN|nr:lactoylglutathione lyase [Pelagerythrobacter marinus]
MSRMIFINLPVSDLERSKAFYEAVGFRNEPRFTNDDAACMVWSDAINVMLLTHGFWKTFTSKTIPDAQTTAQVLLALSQESTADVDAIVARATAAGGRADPTPRQDHGFMYGRSFEDPDGHIWENTFMDMAAMDQGEPMPTEAA